MTTKKLPIKRFTKKNREQLVEIFNSIESTLKLKFGYDWPKDYCDDTCMFLIKLLKRYFGNYGYRFKLIDGKFKGHDHIWIQTSDGTIIDPTAGQFLGKPILRFSSYKDKRYEKIRIA